MSRKQKFSKEIKIIACEKYYHGEGSFKSIAKEVGCNESVLRRWYYAYKEHGSSIFNNTDKNKSYDKDFKLSLIDSYQCGNYSMMELAAKHNIAYSIVQKWISKYNNGVEIKSYDPKGDVYTMKSRKTTFEERLEIVNWVIENNMSYKDAADKYSITYALVYKWTRAYIDKGPEAIEYKKRGPKIKSEIDESSLSEVDKLKLELEKEKLLRKRREFELEVLKKKEEFKRNLLYRK